MARKLSTKISDVARSQYESRIIIIKQLFLSVFVKDTDINFFELNVNKSISDTIEAIDINRHLILEAIDKLNVSKAPGPDGIHAKIINSLRTK